MRLTARLDESTVAVLLDQLLPVTIDLQEEEPGTRWVRVHKPQRFEFVAGQGIRIHTAAVFQWTALGFRIPVTIESIELMLRPLVVEEGEGLGKLVFRPEIEGTDFRMVPAFIDAQIARVINAKLADQGDRLAWHFGQTLAAHYTLPPTISPTADFDLVARDAVVETTNDNLVLSVTLEMRFTREAQAGDLPH
jgi:hypothetical protein